ncbi:MAG: DUF6265 family protein [Chitinophagaceae bacterium]
MKIRSILIVMLIIQTKNSIAQSPSFTTLQWLVGKWVNQTPRGKMIEEWSVINDSTFKAHSYMLSATDSITLESVELRKEGTAAYYIPIVKGQNNEQPVKFKMTSFTSKELIFENPEHDFPQKITYTLISPDSLLAEISGTVNGQSRSRRFPMTKVDQK